MTTTNSNFIPTLYSIMEKKLISDRQNISALAGGISFPLYIT